jgi:hypothetical protein
MLPPDLLAVIESDEPQSSIREEFPKVIQKLSIALGQLGPHAVTLTLSPTHPSAPRTRRKLKEGR